MSIKSKRTRTTTTRELVWSTYRYMSPERIKFLNKHANSKVRTK